MGGPETLIQTIENNYKIEIDNYVMVNFESFTEIIDAMGGVTVDVQQYEADYNYKKFKVELPYGEDVTLNGKQALCFCRIRGCDSDGDVSRTRRQRQVIESIINRVTTASIGDLNKYIDILLPYVDTGYSKTQILTLGVQALTGKWFNYERTQLQMPDEESRTSGSANAWIWVVDYQLAAHKLQTELYGKSNITLNEGRTSIIDVYRGANYSGDYTNSSSNTVSTTLSNNFIPQTTEDRFVPDTTEVLTTEELIEIDNYLTQLNYTLPLETFDGSGIFWQEVYRSDDTIIYECNLSDVDTRDLSEEHILSAISDAELLKKPIITQQWAEMYILGLEDEACSDIVQYVECGMNVAYHFRDSNGIRLYTIKISNSEIWDAIGKKQTY
jgi:LCP family protein required for cell wall assembly